MKKLMSILLASALIFSFSVTAMAEENEKITFGTDKNGAVLNRNEILSPWQTYEFPIKLDGAPLSNELGDKYKIRLENIKGSNAVQEIKVLRGMDNYYLRVKVLPLSYVEQTLVEYRLTMSSGNDRIATEFGFTAGFRRVSNDYINNLTAGDEIRVNNDYPVFTKEQLNQISKINNYKKVTFVGDKWRYTVNVTDKGPANFLYTYNNIENIISKYPQNDFLCLSFPAGSQFSQSILEIDISEYEESFKNGVYAYSYYNGVLTPLSCKLDSENLTAELTVYGLGQYILTDKPLKQTQINNNTNNPATGYNDNMPAAFIALISSAVGIIILKQRIH